MDKFEDLGTEVDYMDTSLFAVRGRLDGEAEEDFSELVQLIGLRVSEGKYCLPLDAISEIIMLEGIRYVPGCPEMIEGVINLRGTIIPALNLRRMMGLEKGAKIETARIVIINREDIRFGILVDGITTVMALPPSSIIDKGLSGRSQSSEYTTKIAKTEDDVIGVLDVEKIVGALLPMLKSGVESPEEAS